MPAALSALAQVPRPWLRMPLTGLSGAIICPRGVCSMRVLNCEYTCSQLENRSTDSCQTHPTQSLHHMDVSQTSKL
jgi:hypothetical protein